METSDNYVQCNLEGINIIGSIIVVKKTIMVDDYNDKGGVTPPCMHSKYEVVNCFTT